MKKFEFSGPSKVVTSTAACVFGTQDDYKKLHGFLKEHEGKKIKVTYELVE